MKTKLEVLYAHPAYIHNEQGIISKRTPVVRYSDACAAIGKLEDEIDRTERLRAAAVKRCDELLAELHQTARAHEIITTGRWDGPAKVL